MPCRATSPTIVIVPAAFLTMAGLLLYGCETTKDSQQLNTTAATQPRLTATERAPRESAPVSPGQSGKATASPEQSDEPKTMVVDARPAALVNGKSLTWAELRPTLSELAGAEALQEVILDRQIKEAAAEAGVVIGPDDAAAERKLLLESLNDDPNQAMRLLDELRDRQHLGRIRFENLLHRNAMLRALVRGNVTVNDEAIRNMHELAHGPKRQARLMVLPNLEAAQSAINLVNSGISFADVAAEASIDSSAPRGGLLEPVSRVDPAYPEAIRQTLWSLDPGQMSGPVLIDDRYAVVMLLKRVAGDGTKIEDVRPSLERAVRIQQERLLMDQLARRLLADTQVTVFDDALHESWSRQKR